MISLVILVMAIALAESGDVNTWCKYENSYLAGYAGRSFGTLATAQEICLANIECNGVTQVS